MAKRKGAKSRKRRFFDNRSRKLFYQHWLMCYKAEHPENVDATIEEYRREKKSGNLDAAGHAIYRGRIAGYKAQLKDLKDGKPRKYLFE